MPNRVPLAICLLILLTGCARPPTPLPYARPYPVEPARAPATLDIQVFRRTQNIEFTNATDKAFGPSTLWLNRRFSLPIEKLAIGENVNLSLSDFCDEFSDTFRAGGFFSTETPDRLVQCELETTGPDAEPVFYGLVVVKGDAD